MKASERLDSSTDRALALVDLFTLDQPVWTVEEIVQRQALARATVYRYVKALNDAGFLAPVAEGGYALGPRFVEMDRQIRLADPLLQIAPLHMAALREQVAGAQLLCRFYGGRVLCIHEDRTDTRIRSSFERGRPFPLFLGAPSKIILANLRSGQLQQLFLHQSKEIAAAGLGQSWLEFRDNLKRLRRTGYAVASDIDAKLVGVAAPIFLREGIVTASICLVRLRKEASASDVEMLGQMAMDAAKAISEQLQGPVLKARPSRARSRVSKSRRPSLGTANRARA